MKNSAAVKQRFDRLLHAMVTITPEKTAPVPPEFVVMDGKFYVANVKSRKGKTITADLYRNMGDFHDGAVMARDVKLAVN